MWDAEDGAAQDGAEEDETGDGNECSLGNTDTVGSMVDRNRQDLLHTKLTEQHIDLSGTFTDSSTNTKLPSSLYHQFQLVPPPHCIQ